MGLSPGENLIEARLCRTSYGEENTDEFIYTSVVRGSKLTYPVFTFLSCRTSYGLVSFLPSWGRGGIYKGTNRTPSECLRPRWALSSSHEIPILFHQFFLFALWRKKQMCHDTHVSWLRNTNNVICDDLNEGSWSLSAVSSHGPLHWGSLLAPRFLILSN